MYRYQAPVLFPLLGPHPPVQLENLLLVSKDDITRLKIADFGLAKQSAGALTTVCGTPQYVAPEVILGADIVKYGPAVRGSYWIGLGVGGERRVMWS